MARFKARVVGLVVVTLLVSGAVTFALWQEPLLTAQAAASNSTYIVKAGDSLHSIAAEFHVGVAALAAANDLSVNASLTRRQILTIPTAGVASAPMQAGTAEPDEEPMAEPTEAATEEAAQEAPAQAATEEAAEESAAEATPAPTEEMAEEASDAASASMAAPVASAAPQIYKVKAGDSLHAIAQQHNVSVTALAAANGLEVNTYLLRGQELIIPGPAAAPAPVSAVAPSAPVTVSVIAPTEAMTGEVEAEATPGMAEEADAEATPEMTEEADAEATPEMTEEPTATPTEEMAEEAATEEDAGTEDTGAEAIEEEAAESDTGASASTTEGAEADTEATPAMTEESDAGTEGTTEDADSEEADAEATPEMAEEADAEEAGADAEATPEMGEEADAEATPEMPEEADAEATEESAEEPTATPTEEMAEEANILDTITEMGDFTILLEALELSGLSETLTTEGPFTLFAPTDAAFQALPAGTIDGLLASSPDDLSQILLYHLLPGEVLSTDMADGVTIVTAQGGIISVTVTADGIRINDAMITVSDIGTSNGVIHVIDAVLLPSDTMTAVPPGAAASAPQEAASRDAASVIIAPASVTDMTTAAQLWTEPSEKIALFSPVAQGGYHSPIEIIGLSNTFEGNVSIDLTAADGTLLAQRMTLGGAESYAFFHSDLRFFVTERTEATLGLHEIDMAEGSILSSAETPLTLLPGQRFIDVNSPVTGQPVCNPILVSGYSNTFEANVVLTLRQPDGNILAQIPTIGGTMGVYRDFAEALAYAVTEPMAVLVSVAETDASGLLNTIDETVIPVTLYPAYNAACY